MLGLLKSVFRAIVNRSRACPPQADLPAVILVRRLCGGLEGLSAVFLEGWPEFFGEEVIVLKIKI